MCHIVEPSDRAASMSADNHRKIELIVPSSSKTVVSLAGLVGQASGLCCAAISACKTGDSGVDRDQPGYGSNARAFGLCGWLYCADG